MRDKKAVGCGPSVWIALSVFVLAGFDACGEDCTLTGSGGKVCTEGDYSVVYDRDGVETARYIRRSVVVE